MAAGTVSRPARSASSISIRHRESPRNARFATTGCKCGMEPACSKACPTDSIQFGTIKELRGRAQKRVDQLHQTGEKRAYLYGADEKMLGGLNSFYLLVDKPEVTACRRTRRCRHAILHPARCFPSWAPFWSA